MALLTANVTVTFPSLIVISAGILPVTVIIMAMIYTCLLIRILKHSDSYVYFLCSFLRSRIIFTCQSSMLEFCWHDHSRFREIIICIRFIFSPFKHRHSFYRSSGMSRSFLAAVLASARRFTSSLSRMWLTWVFTVGSFTSMICAISALDLSAQSRWRICSSVGVRVSLGARRVCKKRG